METIIYSLGHGLIFIIQYFGYAGIWFLMFLESANIPIPSEVIMPFAGFLAYNHAMNFWLAVAWGTIGNASGSVFSYYLGIEGQTKGFLKYFKVKNKDVKLAHKWFEKYGYLTIFMSKILPIARTFISFPAGAFRMDFKNFLLYTVLGSFIWVTVLEWIGYKLGENWPLVETYFGKIDWLVLVIIIVGSFWWIKKHLSNKKEEDI